MISCIIFIEFNVNNVNLNKKVAYETCTVATSDSGLQFFSKFPHYHHTCMHDLEGNALQYHRVLLLVVFGTVFSVALLIHFLNVELVFLAK